MLPHYNLCSLWAKYATCGYLWVVLLWFYMILSHGHGINELPHAICNDQCWFMTVCGKLGKSMEKGPIQDTSGSDHSESSPVGQELESGSCIWHEISWNDMKWHPYIIVYIYIILYIYIFFFSRFYKQMSTSKHVFHAELPVGNPQWFFPISRLTCQKSRARRPIFLVFEPSSSHGRSRGVLWGFLGDSLWPCDSLHPGEKPWITDAMGFSWIFQCLRLPEAYVRLLSCSHQPDMKRWKDRKVKERTSRDSKQQLLTQFLGVERLNLERNPG
jgi:hypothetical protein